MATGKVKWFNNAKGYGFILPEHGSGDLFAHYSTIQMDGYKTLRAGQDVVFDVEAGPKGMHAVNIRPADETAGMNGIREHGNGAAHPATNGTALSANGANGMASANGVSTANGGSSHGIQASLAESTGLKVRRAECRRFSRNARHRPTGRWRAAITSWRSSPCRNRST
jgi:cold shock protein